MTDETARDNFQKYGNPDGPGSYSVAIAMPRFLLKPENQIQVLCCAFFILLVIIPGTVYFNFADSTQKDECGVLLENKMLYGAELNENYLFKTTPTSVYRSIEMQQIRSRSKEDVEALKRLMQKSEFEDLIPRNKSKKSVSLNLKPLILMLGHMFRMKEIEIPALAEDLA